MTHQTNTRPSTGWMLLAVVVQAAIGASMVPLRYLQTVAQLPSLAVIALTDLVAFGIMSWQIFPKVKKRFFINSISLCKRYFIRLPLFS